MTPQTHKRAALVTGSIGIALIMAHALTSCQTPTPAPHDTQHDIDMPVTSSPVPAPSASGLILVNNGNSTNIDSIVQGSACTSYHWKDRGKAPLGYIKGVAKVFQRAVCLKRPNLPLGPSDKDALALYGKEANLINTYTLLLGLGLRESSGKYYEGRDMSASNTSSDTAEAGAWQTSWNSHSANPGLVALFNEYRAHPENCLAATFKEGLGDHMSPNFGSGDGLVFQKLSKECPAFAAEYAALTIRVLRRHYGPINKQAAEFREECRTMFQSIEKATVCK